MIRTKITISNGIAFDTSLEKSGESIKRLKKSKNRREVLDRMKLEEKAREIRTAERPLKIKDMQPHK